VAVVGHDIGLMVAYAYAAQFPEGTERLVLMDAFLPGIGDWKSVWLMRDLWHFHFYGEVPLALVEGRERTYFEHFWNDFAADRHHSVPEADRQFYAEAYAQPGGMRAGFEYFRNFERDAGDFAQMSTTRLAMPVLVLTGEKASGQFLIDQARLVATDVKGVVVKGSGHWLMEEAPDQVIPQLVAFVDEGRGTGSRQRLNPSDIGALPQTGPGAGTSGVTGIRNRVLKGDPARSGVYTIQLEVPANTRIEAHEHPDDRVATVVSGTWYFGYGATFDEKQLKPLAPGSFYTEPPNAPHFARTGASPVVVQISGFGPTGTCYITPVSRKESGCRPGE
jgi:quercetin dioxygenase-like cupin family protein